MDKSKCSQPAPAEQQTCTPFTGALCSTVRWSTGPWDDVCTQYILIITVTIYPNLFISVQQLVGQEFNSVVSIVMIHRVRGFAYLTVNV